MKRLSHILALTSTLAVGIAAASCGSGGEADAPKCVLCGMRSDVRGAIANQNGSQAAMAGWIVAAIERDSMIARVGEVDRAGLYTLGQLKTDEPQTLVVLSPDYIIQSVLSIPGTVEKQIRQFFQPQSPNLPTLIHKGPIAAFQSTDEITIAKDVASDSNGDQIPDGSVSLGAGALGLVQVGSTVDLDRDGVVNEKDPDIDGDGIVNVIDPDDNGNGVYDVFDEDANGDLQNDTGPGQTDVDLYFKEGIEFLSVQFTMAPKDDGSGNETTLTFTTKVRDEVGPLAVQVRGAPSLLNGAMETQINAEGNPVPVKWNLLLADDGKSQDGSEGDRRFAKKVTLDAAKTPRAHEVVFFQLVFGTAEAPWFMEFPYAFPPIKPAPVVATYDPTTRTVLLVSNPFGEIENFWWSIDLLDETGATSLWSSQPIPGTTRQFQVQENVIEPGKKYKYQVVARVLAKIEGYPAYTIYGAKNPLQ